jgi:uncharacterized protein (TIGR02453 family)
MKNMAAYFTRNFFEVYKSLAANNHTEWFHANKQQFEKNVRIPFEQFVSDLLKQEHKANPSVSLDPKEAIFRINRDIRFSADKSPYKLYVSAVISPGGKRMKAYPGMYIEFSSEHIKIYGGAYMPDKMQLHSLRTHIADNLKEFNKLIQEKLFLELLGEIKGEKNKVLPAEFKALQPVQPLIANKNFYVMTELPADLLTSDDLLKTILAYCKACRKLNQFLAEGMGF